MTPRMRIPLLALCTLLAAARAPAELLENPGFETGSLAGWATFGYGWRIVPEDEARTGSHALAVDNHLELDEGTWHGISQDVPITPRQTYTASAYVAANNVRHSSAFLEIQWLDEKGQLLHQVRSPAINRNQSYRLVQLRKSRAPVGAATASIRGIFFMPGTPRNDKGVFTFDDFSFKAE